MFLVSYARNGGFSRKWAKVGQTGLKNEGKENVGSVELPQNQTTIMSHKKKCVSFAPTNTMKEFDDTSAVSSLLQLNESNVQLYDNSGKEPR